jgi:hypothetical protein
MVTDSRRVPLAHLRVVPVWIPVTDKTPEPDDDESPGRPPIEAQRIPIQDPPPKPTQPPLTVRCRSGTPPTPACS